MAKPARKPVPEPPKVEQPALFVVPEGGGAPKHEALMSCDWPISRYLVLEQMTRTTPETITTRAGVTVEVRKTNAYSVEQLANLAGVTVGACSAALDYFERLRLVKTKRATVDEETPSLWVIRQAGKNEFARVRPFMVRRLAQ